MKALNVGAGRTPNPPFEGNVDVEWVRLDGDVDCNPDVVHDITQKFPGELLGQFDMVVLTHVLEHISWRQVKDTVDNIAECLKEGGTFIIVVPDIEWAAKRIIAGKNDLGIIGMIYGGQQDEWQYHKSGFTKDELAWLMQECGMIVTKVLVDWINVYVVNRVYENCKHIIAYGIKNGE